MFCRSVRSSTCVRESNALKIVFDRNKNANYVVFLLVTVREILCRGVLVSTFKFSAGRKLKTVIVVLLRQSPFASSISITEKL